MPFNGSGTYSLSDTIANGTPNDADELQAILDDIATGLSNAVCVDGQSTMTGVLKASNGSAAAPSLTFGSDTNTGIYRVAADSVGVAVNGSLLATFNSSGITLASGTFVGASPIPSGTKMLFQQTAAPTGWTKDTTHNNKALRVVSGTASSGGSVAFTTAFASQSVSGTIGATTLTENQIPSHKHFVAAAVSDSGGTLTASNQTTFDESSGSSVDYLLKGTVTAATIGLTSATGGGASHDHTFTGTAIDLAVQYVDIIICQKD